MDGSNFDENFNSQVRVSHHDGSTVPIDENTKKIQIVKQPSYGYGSLHGLGYGYGPNYGHNVGVIPRYSPIDRQTPITNTTYELDSTGSVNVQVPTSLSENGFQLKVSGSYSFFQYFRLTAFVRLRCNTWTRSTQLAKSFLS